MQKPNKKRGELFWPRMMMRKWLNSKSTGDEFSSDEYNADEHDDTELENKSECECKGKGGGSRKSLDTNDKQPEALHKQYFDMEEVRIAVGTWNVAGRTPPPYLDLKSWLEMNDPADIYVLGFQEIVPLNRGSVFGAEDNGSTMKWQALIRTTLNRTSFKDCTFYSAPPSPSREAGSEASNSYSGDSEMDTERVLIDEETSFIPLELPRSQLKEQEQDDQVEGNMIKVYRCTERIDLNKAQHQRTNSAPRNWLSAVVYLPLDGGSIDEETVVRPLILPVLSDAHAIPVKKLLRYVQVASKQMVGIHISVWVRRVLRQYISNLTVSCVGLGIMGCLGNKGSISVSMTLHETSFCFVCTHLSSGDKGDELVHRNADVTEILKRTRFASAQDAVVDVPKTIWGHDRIIWFGDMNYRLNMSDSEVRFHVAREDWTALLGKDQLKKELFKGHIFDGWYEGSISFAPTYKYEFDSDRYSGETAKHREKRRAPAWCDRILWHGKGLKQLSYRREELTISDHRPVVATFLAEVEVSSEYKFKKAMLLKIAKVEVEELLSKIEHPMGSRKVYPEQAFSSSSKQAKKGTSGIRQSMY